MRRRPVMLCAATPCEQPAHRTSEYLLIKPGSAAVGRLRSRLAAEMHALRGSNAAAVIAALNPVILGWAAYYRGVVSSKIFGELDNYAWKLTWRWAKRTHSGKPKRWIAHRYYGKFDKFRPRTMPWLTPGISASRATAGSTAASSPSPVCGDALRAQAAERLRRANA
jgi:hypothetical protein